MSDLNENFLKKQTKKKSFEFKHNDGDTIKSLFGDKTDEKEAETDNDADKDTEKETTSMKVKWRLRNFNVHFFLN